MMMFELFNEAARKVLFHATEEAIALGHDEIEPEHLVLGVMNDTDGIAAIALAENGVKRRLLADAITDRGTATAGILQSIGIDLQSIRNQAEATFGPGGTGSAPAAERRAVSFKAQRRCHALHARRRECSDEVHARGASFQIQLYRNGTYPPRAPSGRAGSGTSHIETVGR